MKKFTFILAILMLFLVFTSCDKTTTNNTVTEPLTLSEIVSKITESTQLPDMMILSEDNIADFYGIEESEYTEQYVSICENSLQKDQIVIFKASDTTTAQNIKEKLETARQNALHETKNYLPDQYDLIEKSEVYVNDLYVALFVSKDAKIIIELFESLI